MNPLHDRLASVRRRMRLTIICRGLCWLGAVLLAVVVADGLVDWQMPAHLPAPVRALILTGGLAAAIIVAQRWLFGPLATRTDDLSLALRIEARHPDLKDSLASTVQFLGAATVSDATSSPTLRQAVVEKTLAQAGRCDFDEVVDTNGVRSAGLCFLLSAVAAAALVILSPGLAAVAFARLAAPYSGLAWPTQTHLNLIDFHSRIARGEPYDITCAVSGIVPDTGTIDLVGAGMGSQTYKITGNRLVARLGRMERSFHFVVRVHDAVLDRSVEVLPPPVLVPLDGRASPQVHLAYPAYSDLRPQQLPAGSGNIDAVAGTVATLRAAADRPLARAWIEYQPEIPNLKKTAPLSCLGTTNPLGVVALYAVSRELWSPLPVQLQGDGRIMEVQFTPCTSGYYLLSFEDTSGLGNRRLFDLHSFADPAPVVSLERPSPSRDSLMVLPDADVPVRVVADDPQYAVRSVVLEYRTHSQDEARPWPLYDHQTAGQAIAAVDRLPLNGGLLAAAPSTSVRLRLPHVAIDRRLSLRGIRHPDGKPLQPGDLVILQAAADDFDDVSLDKAPGRSSQVELHIVRPDDLEQSANKTQAHVQQELTRLRKLQQDALAPVIAAEQRWRHTGRITQRDVDKLIQAQQTQQQVRERIGAKNGEGLRAEVDRVLRTMKDNHLPRSGAQDRMTAVASELARLAHAELPPIEPELATARKDNENTTRPHVPGADEKGPLDQARQHQENVESTLNGLLKLMEPWGSLNEVRGEAQDIRQQQGNLHNQTRSLASKVDPGTPREGLSPEQQTALDQAAEAQRKLQERADSLLAKMGRVGEQRKNSDPANAKAARDAARVGEKEGLSSKMKEAAGDISSNQLNNALKKQQDSLKTLDNMVKQLEEHREQELDQLRKKLNDLQSRLDDLAQQQEELRKKARDAAALKDPKQREKQLRRLARAQEKLRQETQDALRQLTRMRAERAGQALSDAADSMNQAGEQLSRGENPEDAQEETLDRLNEARRRVQQARQDVEDELAREKLARVADQIKLLRDRHKAAIDEMQRLRTEALQNKSWSRDDRNNLIDLADAQKGLGQETKTLAEDKLAAAHVFAHILKGAAQALTDAADRLNSLASGDGKDDDNERAAVKLQQTALRRFDQLLDALKSAGSAPARAAQAKKNGQQGDQQGGNQGNSPGGDADGIPQLAQLKALRNLQAEVNDDTDIFGKKHPDLSRLSDHDLQQLKSLREAQAEVAELLDELMAPAGAGGDKK